MELDLTAAIEAAQEAGLDEWDRGTTVRNTIAFAVRAAAPLIERAALEAAKIKITCHPPTYECVRRAGHLGDHKTANGWSWNLDTNGLIHMTEFTGATDGP